jgi:hypothetical protein
MVEGDDLPPADRLRTEGMMEAVVMAQAASEDEVNSAMDACYRRVHGHGLSQALGQDWRTFFPFPQIPAFARRAPVYPSTQD